MIDSLKAVLGRRLRRFGWDLRNRGGSDGLGNFYNETLDKVVGPIVVSLPEGTVIEGMSHIRHDLMGRHCPSTLRTPFWPVAQLRLLLGKAECVDEAAFAIHPYCGFEYNHYHMLIDVAPRLLAYARSSELAGVPILVNNHILNSSVMQQLLTLMPELRDRLIAPREQFVRVKRLHVFNRPGVSREKFLGLQADFSVPDLNPSRRVFLIRKGTRRALSNQEAIADRLKLLDFVPVDFAGMEMQEQIRWACETRYLVAVHGAGITNYLFHRVGQLSFLELTPPSKQTDWAYREMAQAMGWDYQVLSGVGKDSGDTFEIDPDLVSSTTEALVRLS